MSPATTLVRVQRAGRAAAVLAVAAGVVLVLQGHWGPGVVVWLAGTAVLSAARKSRRGLDAAQEWPLPRVREVLAAAGVAGADRVERVRQLRRADRRLTLLDAVALVDRVAMRTRRRARRAPAEHGCRASAGEGAGRGAEERTGASPAACGTSPVLAPSPPAAGAGKRTSGYRGR